MVHRVAADWREANLEPTDRALCEWAVLLTTSPARTDAARLDQLRSLGLSDRAIHDAAQVVAYFNYITRIAEGLGVEPETFIRPWGRPTPAPADSPGPGESP